MSNQPPNNEPWRQPPNTSYPPQQPYPGNQPYPQQPMYSPPPKKKSRTWLWIVLGVVGVLVLGCIGVSALVFNAASNVSTTTISTLATTVATTALGNTPFPTGQVAKVGQTIIVNDVATTLVFVKKLPDDQFSPASPGNTYIFVHVKIVNNSSGEVDYNPFDFHVKSGSGNITTETFTSSYTANNQLNSGKLSPGGNVEGDIVFQTGKSDHKAQLTWQPSFFGNAGDNGWFLGL
jgi:Domain of unknown function (DUF4352)